MATQSLACPQCRMTLRAKRAISPTEMIRCPQCGSSNIEYPQMTRKFLTPALMGLLCAPRIIPKEFYCQDCHYTWSNEEERTIGRLWHRFFPGEEKAT